MEFNCRLICNGGYWQIDLPFNSGSIDLGDSIQEAIDINYELQVINHLEGGLSIKEIAEEMSLEVKTITALVKRVYENSLNDGKKDG